MNKSDLPLFAEMSDVREFSSYSKLDISYSVSVQTPCGNRRAAALVEFHPASLFSSLLLELTPPSLRPTAYKFPESFPINTIQCIRFLRAVEKVHPDRLEKATSLFWELVWVRSDGHKAEEAIVPEFFGKKFVESKIFTETEVSDLMEVAQSTEIKDALKTEAAELVHKGYAFGFVRFPP